VVHTRRMESVDFNSIVRKLNVVLCSVPNSGKAPASPGLSAFPAHSAATHCLTCNYSMGLFVSLD
jgi:hypothetical protein